MPALKAFALKRPLLDGGPARTKLIVCSGNFD